MASACDATAFQREKSDFQCNSCVRRIRNVALPLNPPPTVTLQASPFQDSNRPMVPVAVRNVGLLQMEMLGCWYWSLTDVHWFEDLCENFRNKTGYVHEHMCYKMFFLSWGIQPILGNYVLSIPILVLSMLARPMMPWMRCPVWCWIEGAVLRWTV